MEASPLKEANKKTYKINFDKNKLFNLDIYNYHNSIYIYAFFQGEILKEEYEKNLLKQN